jgi:hypothetical protein
MSVSDNLIPSRCFGARLRGSHLQNSQVTDRRKAPVFVVGCHRSGTNLLYDTLLSAGDFAVYRGYIPIYKMLIPRFGNLDKASNRRRLMKTWLTTKGFRRSGLEAGPLTKKVVEDCRNGGDFIRTTMDEIARRQNVGRWALYDPDNLLYIPKIKKDIPSALFVHIIRDGRDIALSLRRMGGFQPLPWDRGNRSLQATALYWEWMVRKGQLYGNMFPSDYLEIRYEELVTAPQRTLESLSEFLDHDLNFETIRSASLGRLRESNSSFRKEQGDLNPVNRWKERLSREEIVALETVIGPCLEEHGYSLTIAAEERRPAFRESYMRYIYPKFLDGKLWLKIDTPAGRLANLSSLELAESAESDAADDGPPADQSRVPSVMRE